MLTSREWQVMKLTHEGLVPKQIAQQLNVTPKTVRSHMHTAKVKLGCSNMAQAAFAAHRLDVSTPLVVESKLTDAQQAYLAWWHETRYERTTADVVAKLVQTLQRAAVLA
jgi:DNA-binding CsgD family transcriptional regulator